MESTTKEVNIDQIFYKEKWGQKAKVLSEIKSYVWGKLPKYYSQNMYHFVKGYYKLLNRILSYKFQKIWRTWLLELELEVDMKDNGHICYFWSSSKYKEKI